MKLAEFWKHEWFHIYSSWMLFALSVMCQLSDNSVEASVFLVGSAILFVLMDIRAEIKDAVIVKSAS